MRRYQREAGVRTSQHSGVISARAMYRATSNERVQVVAMAPYWLCASCGRWQGGIPWTCDDPWCDALVCCGCVHPCTKDSCEGGFCHECEPLHSCSLVHPSRRASAPVLPDAWLDWACAECRRLSIGPRTQCARCGILICDVCTRPCEHEPPCAEGFCTSCHSRHNCSRYRSPDAAG